MNMSLAKNVFDITHYGAVSDGTTVNTSAIQKAIDACEKDGIVYVPSGVFVTGALFLKSNMTLYLEKGAKIIGSSDIKDYPIIGCPYEGLDQLCYASLICTDGAPHKNITIDGKGIIDANGVALFNAEMSENKGKRGRAVCIRNTEKVTIKNVTIRQSPAWCLHLIYCDNVTIDNIEIHTKFDENGNKYAIYNCDGIDIDACKNVSITNSLIASQDDCIAIKSGRNEEGRRVGIPSENIVIENCTFLSGFGVAVGSEMSGGVRNVSVSECTFENTYSIASIKAPRGRGNVVENIVYENCTLVNNSTEHSDCKWFRGGLYIDTFYSISDKDMDVDKAEAFNETTPVFRNITLRNIDVKTVAGNAIYLCGLPEAPLENITLENVTAKGKYGMKAYNIKGLNLINVKIDADEGEKSVYKNIVEI